MQKSAVYKSRVNAYNLNLYAPLPVIRNIKTTKFRTRKIKTTHSETLPN